ncbi:MAG: glycoside hydrolase family 2 TIM barrel-domain containing protein [Spirochaetales bacterium]|nr:glycoside hydrolase family 2 TIM barrel-domain containing protein [Spirochaetales bacterium]
MEIFWILILLIFLYAAAALYSLFFRFTMSKNPFSKSKLETVQWEGFSYIKQNGLPYHSHFYRTNRYRVKLENWTFRTEKETEALSVSVPHCFNTAGSPLKDYEGPVYYSCTHKMEREDGCHLVIMGSFYRTEVYINDRLAGSNEGGYLPFRIPLDSVKACGETINILIKVDNRVTEDSVPSLVYPGHAMGFHPYGGLHKPVYMEYMPEAYAFKVHAHPRMENDTGHVRIDSLFHRHNGMNKAENGKESECTLQVYDPSGKICFQGTSPIVWKKEIGAADFYFQLADPLQWNHRHPALYRAVVTKDKDEVEIRFGFSSLKVEGTGFTHNGEKIILKGACRHEEEISRGLAQSHSSMEKDLSLARELGMNYLRLSHYPHDPWFLDRCDEEGIHIWEEIPLYQSGLAPVKYIADKSSLRRDKGIKRILRLPGMIRRTRQLTRSSVLSQAHDDLIRMIERDFNHPALGFWGIGNECWSLNPAGASALKKLKDVVSQRDPDRIAAYAAMTIPGLTIPFERAFKVMDFISINEYFGWYYGSINDLDGFLNKLHRKFQSKPVMISETGPDCAFGERSEKTIPEKGVSEEYQAHYLKEQYKIMKHKPFFAGLSIWVLKDFLCPEYGTDNFVPFFNLKGLFSADYHRKAAADTVKEIYREEKDYDFIKK